jgi:hypothetical protein
VSEYDEIIKLSNEGLAVLVPTPYGRAVMFLEEPAPIDTWTPLTHEVLCEIADEFEANRDQWPEDMWR